MTLKTLKDIKLRPFDSGNTIEEIREAAREWRLDLQEAIKDTYEVVEELPDVEKWEAQIEWIETFFNLEGDK